MYACFSYTCVHTLISATPGHQRAAPDAINRSTIVQFCGCSQVILLLSCFGCVWLYATLQTAAHQVPQSTGFSRQEYWTGLTSLTRGSSWPRNQTRVYCTAGSFFTAEPPGKAQALLSTSQRSFRTLSGNRWFFTICIYFSFLHILFFLKPTISWLYILSQTYFCTKIAYHLLVKNLFFPC